MLLSRLQKSRNFSSSAVVKLTEKLRASASDLRFCFLFPIFYLLQMLPSLFNKCCRLSAYSNSCSANHGEPFAKRLPIRARRRRAWVCWGMKKLTNMYLYMKWRKTLNCLMDASNNQRICIYISSFSGCKIFWFNKFSVVFYDK